MDQDHVFRLIQEMAELRREVKEIKEMVIKIHRIEMNKELEEVNLKINMVQDQVDKDSDSQTTSVTAGNVNAFETDLILMEEIIKCKTELLNPTVVMVKLPPIENSTKLTPMERALKNPIIIKTVFKHLNFNTLKQARRVCKDWITPSTEAIVQKSYLNLNIVLSSSLSTPEISEALVRNIKYSFTEWTLEIKWEQIVSFCERYSTKITEMFFNLYCINVNFVQSLHRILYEICPNVKVLNLKENYDDNMCEMEIPVVPQFEFNKRLGLQSVSLEVNRSLNSAAKKLNPFINKLLNCSGNLRSLEIRGNVFPHLNSNVKLEILKFRQTQSSKEHNPSFNYKYLKKMNRMVDEVSDCLQTLVFDVDYDFDSIEEFDKLVFLKRPCARGDWLILNVYCQSLRSLELRSFVNPEVLELAEKSFPNLSKLEFEFGKWLEISADSLTRVIAVCSRMKLQNLKITLNVDVSLDSLCFYFLEDHPNLFENLKTLVITFGTKSSGDDSYEYTYTVAEYWSCVPKLLMLTRTLERCELQHVVMLAHEAIKMAKFISDNNLPVILS